MLRLYLKGLCELAGDDDRIQFVCLNGGAAPSEDLQKYADAHLAGGDACGGGKIAFVWATLRRGLASDRVICGHIGFLPLVGALSIVRPRLEYYLVAHGIEVWRPYSMVERFALRRARSIWCVSEYTRQQVLRYSGLPAEAARVLPNALDPFLDVSNRKPAAFAAPVILTVSRLSSADAYKGIDHLIDALPAVRKDVPGARLRVVGTGDALPALLERAARLGLAEAVEFTGFLSDADLSAAFDQCRLFALPSEREGFGLVYLEAMSHGVPCLGARSAGAPEVIDSHSGVLVDYGDVAGLATALAGALAREWPEGPILERARHFSYLRFKDRLASVLQA